MQHITSIPPSPALINPTIPPALTMVIVNALAKDPAARFPSASSMTIAVAQALDRPIPEELSQCADAMIMNAPTFLSQTRPLQPMGLTPSLSLQPTQVLPSGGQDFSPADSIPGVAPTVDVAQHTPSTPSLPPQTQEGAHNFIIPQSVVGENLEEHLAHLNQTMAERNVLISTSTGPSKPLPRHQGRDFRVRHVLRAGLLISLVIVLLLGGLSLALFSLHSHSTTPTTLQLGIGVTKAPNGDYIGISDGTFAFDTQGPDRTDGSIKQQAAAKLKAGDVGSAVTLWQSAVAQDTNDAESLIYLEDQHVLASGYPYITLVVATVLSGNYVGFGRADLQGAYVAQREYNDGFKLNGTQVRLLVANTGTDREYVKPVAQQIVQAAQTDKTIVGVMGLPASKQVLDAINVLAAAHIPLVSQSASSDLLTGVSPYFFRVAPPDTSQGIAGAKFVEQTLHAKKAALFVDPTDAYSKSLADAFKQKFIADGNSIVVTEQYTTVSKPEALPTLLQDALSYSPDCIYFSGYGADVSVILTDLPTSGPFANLIVMGGDGLYQAQGYSQEAHAKLGRLRFTAFAFPDEWDVQGLSAQKPAFFREYPEIFNPGSKPHPNPYGYSRPDSQTMLSFDATMAMLEGCRIALAGGKTSFTPHDLRQALATITGPRAIQGVTGQIAFGPDGNAIDKAFVVLSVTQDGFIHIQSVQGRFLNGS